MLVLGGTTEGRLLADALAGRVRVTSSLAGRVAAPGLLAGAVRVGGFGGAAGLARWLAEQDVTAVLDATHPFAAAISASAVDACARTGTPLLRLERPPWDAGPGDSWHRVDGAAAAAHRACELGRRVFVTLGRGGLDAFAARGDAWFVIRSIDRPAPPLPAHCTSLLGRGPFSLESERALLIEHAIDVLVTRDSGGEATAPKLAAARDLGLPVVVIARPRCLARHTVASVDEAVAWASRIARSAGRSQPAVGDHGGPSA